MHTHIVIVDFCLRHTLALFFSSLHSLTQSRSQFTVSHTHISQKQNSNRQLTTSPPTQPVDTTNRLCCYRIYYSMPPPSPSTSKLHSNPATRVLTVYTNFRVLLRCHSYTLLHFVLLFEVTVGFKVKRSNIH